MHSLKDTQPHFLKGYYFFFLHRPNLELAEKVRGRTKTEEVVSRREVGVTSPVPHTHTHTHTNTNKQGAETLSNSIEHEPAPPPRVRTKETEGRGVGRFRCIHEGPKTKDARMLTD